jgi:hypothetical protein
VEPLILELLAAKRFSMVGPAVIWSNTRVHLECEMERLRVARCCRIIVGLKGQELYRQGITCGETGMRFAVALFSGAKEGGWSCRWDVL